MKYFHYLLEGKQLYYCPVWQNKNMMFESVQEATL